MKHSAWEDVPREALSESIGRRYIAGEKVMAAQIELKKGTVTPVHEHEAEQISYVMSGALRFQIEGRELIVKAGETLVIPSNEAHGAEALEDTLVLDVFSPIRYDWFTK